jgi:hypothetical protein
MSTLDLNCLDEVIEGLLSDDRLTTWERGFVESIAAWLEEDRTLSERQIEVLERIHVKY